MVKIKLRQPIAVQPHKRLHDHVMDVAMGDVVDALVELITNADDSYGRLYRNGKRPKNGGRILVERFEQRKGQPSYLVVRDHAEGMTLERMIYVLQTPGAMTSSSGDRGYMGRGAKDCARFGMIVFESIKDDCYYRCVLTKRATQVIPEVARDADKDLRQSLGILHGNGTVVRLEVGDEFKNPQIKTLHDELSNHYALQDILDEHSHSEVFLRNGLRPDDKQERLVSRQPAADVVCENETFAIPGYAGVEAKISIYRSTEAFEERPQRTRRFGFLIVGKRTIHERSLLDSVIERDLNSRHYFGRIECDHIDTLLAEYEQRRNRGEAHPTDNPRLLIDPGRRHGMEKDHPFTTALFREPIGRVRALLDEDRKKSQLNRREIANRETSQRLDRLARAASRFLQQQIDDLQELSADEAVDEESFIKTGVLIYPTYLNVRPTAERALTVYVNRALLNSVDEPVLVTVDSDALEVIGAPFTLRPHKSKEDRFIGTFKVRGRTLAKDICIRAQCNGLPAVEALAQVVEERVEDRAFVQDFEFEREEYRVNCGAQKTLRLFAKVPDVIQAETDVAVVSDDVTTVAVRGRCQLVPVKGTNYAVGDVMVHGRRLKAKATVSASVNAATAETEVKIVDKPDNRRGPTIRIELRDEDFGNFRARWADHEGRPNVLMIAGRHESLARYLGPAKGDGTFPGQDNPIYRVLLAEIVAEAVCRKSLQLEARERPWDFKWADLKDDDKISDDVVARLQQRLRGFLPIAHRQMVQETDAKKPVIIDSF